MYKIDKKNKIITATISELDEVEKEIVQMYINGGYILRKNKKNPWNKKSITKWLTENVSKEKADDFQNDCANIGWVQARKKFFAEFPKEKREPKNK